MYFLPNTFNSVEQASDLADAVARPVLPDSRFTTGVAVDPAGEQPMEFTLLENYPNPFNQGTSLTFTLPQPEHIRLEIYDSRGALVRLLQAGLVDAGQHRLFWDGRDEHGADLASGVYFCQLHGAGQAARHKLLLLR